MKRNLVLCLSLLALAPAAFGLPNEKARAAEFYRRGVAAEAKAKASYTQWVKTVRTPPLDAYVKQWVTALENYTNATWLNPSHWQAQKRLGLLYAGSWGSYPNDYMALLHLTAYLALQPNDAGADQAKELADRSLNRVMSMLTVHRVAGEGGLAHALRESGLVAPVEPEPAAGEGGEMGAPGGAPGGGAMPAGGGMPGGESSAGMEGMGMEGGEGAAAPDPIKIDLPDLSAAGIAALAAGASGEARGQFEQALRDLNAAAAYVPACLTTIAGMHRLMTYWDQSKVAYDPRLPQALIGECVLQIRRQFTRQRVANLAQLRQEYQKVAGLGGVTEVDLFGQEDPTTALPEFLLAAEKVEIDQADRQFWSAAAKTWAVRMPSSEGDDYLSNILATIAVTDQASYEWLSWRKIAFAGLPEVYGVASAERVFLRDYELLGTGEITIWPHGPLAPARTNVGQLHGDRQWLLAANEK